MSQGIDPGTGCKGGLWVGEVVCGSCPLPERLRGLTGARLPTKIYRPLVVGSTAKNQWGRDPMSRDGTR